MDKYNRSRKDINRPRHTGVDDGEKKTTDMYQCPKHGVYYQKGSECYLCVAEHR